MNISKEKTKTMVYGIGHEGTTHDKNRKWNFTTTGKIQISTINDSGRWKKLTKE